MNKCLYKKYISIYEQNKIITNKPPFEQEDILNKIKHLDMKFFKENGLLVFLLFSGFYLYIIKNVLKEEYNFKTSLNLHNFETRLDYILRVNFNKPLSAYEDYKNILKYKNYNYFKLGALLALLTEKGLINTQKEIEFILTNEGKVK